MVDGWTSTPDVSDAAPPVTKRRRRRVVLAVGAIALVLGLAVALPVFQPWKLFIDTRVDEAFPVVTAGPAPSTTPPSSTAPPTASAAPVPAAPTTTAPAGAVAVASERRGSFSSRNHPTAGTARLVALTDGQVVVRLEDFETDNGPDVVVYLSPAAGDAPSAALGEDPVFLGELKGNVGNQNYVVPAGIDLSKHRSVVIWCRRFSVPFGVAGLEAV